VGLAEVGDGGVVEGPPGTCAVADLVEPGSELGVGAGGPQPSGELDGGGMGSAVLDDALAAGDDHLVGGAGVPADPDAGLGQVGLGEQGDVGDEGPQQPLAVPGRGGRRVPQARHVGGEGLELGPGRQGRDGGLRLGQGLVGLGQGRQTRLPAGLQAAGH